jgi:hypothetical protein
MITYNFDTLRDEAKALGIHPRELLLQVAARGGKYSPTSPRGDYDLPPQPALTKAQLVEQLPLDLPSAINMTKADLEKLLRLLADWAIVKTGRA